MLNTPRPQPATPRPSYPAPKQNVHFGIVERFMADQAKKRGFDVAIRPSSFGLDHDGDGYPDKDRAMTAAVYDLIKNNPRGEFVEMGVKLKQDRFGDPKYKYSRGISGGPFSIESTQWDKLGFDPFNPKNWLTKDITTLHTQPAIGATSLAPSGGDLSFANERFNGANHYIFSWQDGKLRESDKDGREVRVVHEIPNWRPR